MFFSDLKFFYSTLPSCSATQTTTTGRLRRRWRCGTVPRYIWGGQAAADSVRDHRDLLKKYYCFIKIVSFILVNESWCKTLSLHFIFNRSLLVKGNNFLSKCFYCNLWFNLTKNTCKCHKFFFNLRNTKWLLYINDISMSQRPL